MTKAEVVSFQYSKSAKPVGITPAVALYNPKYAHNVGAAMRAASCYGVKQLFYSGDRVSMESKKGARLPREERMKGYQDVELRQVDYFFDCFEKGTVTPVAIEVRDNSEQLPTFEHPENALYVFGPEDGSIPSVYLQHCHRFVMIPTRHCTNLAAAVYTVLYDRHMKRQLAGLEPIVATKDLLAENRGYEDPNDLWGVEGNIASSPM